MKRFTFGLLATFGILALLGVGLAFLRPDLLPWSTQISSAEADDYGLYCKEHGVPEKFCTLCHPELKDKLLLCPEHGNIPEEICTLCHPENQEKYDVVVCEHGLPLHFCPQDHGGDTASVGSPNLINDGWCKQFGQPQGPDGAPLVCELLPLVRLANADLSQQIGLTVAPVTEEVHTHELIAAAETAYDANRYAEITPRITGFLREARFDLGDKVGAGEVLAVVDSAEVSTAKSEYIAGKDALRLADINHQRVEKLLAQGAIAGQEGPTARSALNQARAGMLAAEQKLRNFRFTDADLAEIVKTNDTTPLLEVRSPISGTVVHRHAVLGEAVEPSMKLYTVADTAKLWVWVDVYERDIAQVQPGQSVHFTVSDDFSASEAPSHLGKVTWVGAEVNKTTRTTKVRVEIPNDGTLRANQFGRAAIQLGEPHKALLVPKSAVQRYENVDMVFLPQEASIYRPQRIKTRSLDQRRGDLLEVTWGLTPGQEVVDAGAFMLKTEIMRGSIGAGCCE